MILASKDEDGTDEDLLAHRIVCLGGSCRRLYTVFQREPAHLVPTFWRITSTRSPPVNVLAAKTRDVENALGRFDWASVLEIGTR